MTNASTAQGREPVDAGALMRAVEGGDAAAVKSLLDAGAQVNVAAAAGETALMRAAARGHLEVVRLLLGAGADVHARSENGFTALFMAVFFGHAAVVRALLEAGSDPAAPMQLNTSPEKWAELWGDAEIAMLLKGARDGRGEEESANEGGAPGEEQSFLFPDEGQFRPVVPLSEIDGARADEESDAPATYEAGPQEGDAVEGRRAAPAANEDGPEEKTLVRARFKNAYPPRAFAPGAGRRSWPALALTLALSVTAGLLVGTYLVWPRRAAEAPPLASAAGGAGKTEAANQPPDSRPADAPELITQPQSATASDRPGGGDQTGAATAGTGRNASDAKPAQTISTPAGRGADEDEASGRRVTKVALVNREHPARSAEDIKDNSAPSKPKRDDAREARGASALSSNSVPPEHSPPISSPPPSAKSRNVIKWP
jgi:uncharacterized protein